MINVLQYLEQTIEHMDDPEKVAFYGGVRSVNGNKTNDCQTTLSFRDLSDVSRSIGSFIVGNKIKKRPVAVFMQKSPAMIAAFLGVVYSGNYYVPLDAEIPAFRRRLILEAVDPPLIICDEATSKLITGEYVYVNFNKICYCPVDESALADIRSEAIDADPVYVVFTSGSTGIPKGVVATHRSVIDYIDNLSKVLGLTSETIFGNQSPLYLDACLKEIYTTLKCGSSAYLIPQSLFMFPVKLIEYINDNEINTICWVASALSLVAGLGALKAAIPKSLHTIAFGSEVFPIKHYNLWRETLPNAKFIHLYGPTEATGMSCYYEVTRKYDADGAIPIGHPFPNTEIILIDDNGAIPQEGQPGEICIRGTCLSPGYFGDSEKTSSSFVQNPLSTFPDIIYKTGDLGRRGAGGELYYISRRDHQIKHMGHRIELAEIEVAANSCNGVGLACAVFDDIESRIILYYTALADIVSKSTVRSYLKDNLPRYMLPHSIFQLDNLPRSPGGKIDRVGLLEKYRKQTHKTSARRT